MKTAKLGDIFTYEGEVVQVRWINEGHRSIGFVPINAKPCECCGETKRWDIIESSPSFQNNAALIQTLKED
jgi:hypothetical protein